MAEQFYLGSKEWVGHGVTIVGVPQDTYEWCDLPASHRGLIPEEDWRPASELTILGGIAGHMIGPGTPFVDNAKGERKIYTRVPDNPEIPIEKAGDYELIEP